MNWKTAGPPTQLEIERDNQIHLVTKAYEIASEMNSYFIDKVKKISQSLSEIPLDLSGCRIIMNWLLVKSAISYLLFQFWDYDDDIIFTVAVQPLVFPEVLCIAFSTNNLPVYKDITL